MDTYLKCPLHREWTLTYKDVETFTTGRLRKNSSDVITLRLPHSDTFASSSGSRSTSTARPIGWDRSIREYQAQLFTVHKLTPGSVTNHLCALRFLYIQTLKRPWSIADTPYPKKRYRLPTILSQEEVAQLIEAAPTPFYRTILMTLYGTGVRRTELTRLKVSDIDSRRMVVHAHSGRQGSPRPRRQAQPRPARGTARSLGTLAQKVCLVISRQPLAQR